MVGTAGFEPAILLYPKQADYQTFPRPDTQRTSHTIHRVGGKLYGRDGRGRKVNMIGNVYPIAVYLVNNIFLRELRLDCGVIVLALTLVITTR